MSGNGEVRFDLTYDILDEAGAVIGIFRQKPETDHEVGFTAAHGLLEVENGVVRLPGKAGDALLQQITHTAGDEGFGEILGDVGVPDDFVQLLDLVGNADFKGFGLEGAGVADGLHGNS